MDKIGQIMNISKNLRKQYCSHHVHEKCPEGPLLDFFGKLFQQFHLANVERKNRVEQR